MKYVKHKEKEGEQAPCAVSTSLWDACRVLYLCFSLLLAVVGTLAP